MTIEDATVHIFSCDLCGRTARGEAAELPPPGFALLKVRPVQGVGAAVVLCLDTCLSIGADRLAEGLTIDGAPARGSLFG